MTTPADNPSIALVDAAVRSVLGDLLRPTLRPGRIPSPAARRPAPDIFAGRLLSLREVESLPRGSRVVRIAPGTVVTPLAREHMKREGVEIVFVSGTEVNRLRNVGEWGFAIEADSGLVEAFRRSILEGSESWLEVGETVEDAIGWVGESQDRGAVVLTEEPALAVYRAHQGHGIRAAAADDPVATLRAVRSIGANLLAVEAPGKSIATLRQIFATFRRAGGPRVPDHLQPSWEASR